MGDMEDEFSEVLTGISTDREWNTDQSEVAADGAMFTLDAGEVGKRTPFSPLSEPHLSAVDSRSRSTWLASQAIGVGQQ